MTVIEKILKSWWAVFSAIMLINGFGFLYIGLKNNNRSWIMEGIAYEIPWIFAVIYQYFEPLNHVYFRICLLSMLISIVRSVWVAVKLCDVYDNEEKYRVQTTVVNSTGIASQNNEFPTLSACGGVLLLIFIALAIIYMF